MTWIVKSGDWYYSDQCWFDSQRMAERFYDRAEAGVARLLACWDGYYDARIVKLVPARDYVFVNPRGEYVSGIAQYPAYYASVDPEKALVFDLDAAIEFTHDWDEWLDENTPSVAERFRLEVIECSKS